MISNQIMVRGMRMSELETKEFLQRISKIKPLMQLSNSHLPKILEINPSEVLLSSLKKITKIKGILDRSYWLRKLSTGIDQFQVWLSPRLRTCSIKRLVEIGSLLPETFSIRLLVE